MNGGAVQTGKPEWVWPHRSDKSQALRGPVWVFYGQAQKRLLTKVLHVGLWGKTTMGPAWANPQHGQQGFSVGNLTMGGFEPRILLLRKVQHTAETGRTVLTLASTFSHNPIHLGYISRCGWWYIPLEHSDSSWCKSKKWLHHFWAAWISGPQVMAIN